MDGIRTGIETAWTLGPFAHRMPTLTLISWSLY